METVIDNDLLDLKEAAAFLKRTPRALYNLIHKGKLPHFKHCSRLFFSKKELEALIKASRVDARTDGGDNE